MGKTTPLEQKVIDLDSACTSYTEGLAAFRWLQDNRILDPNADVDELARTFAFRGKPSHVQVAIVALMEKP